MLEVTIASSTLKKKWKASIKELKIVGFSRESYRHKKYVTLSTLDWKDSARFAEFLAGEEIARTARWIIDETLTWSCDTTDIELVAVIDFEILLNYRSFGLAGAVDRREEVLRIDFIVYPLVTGETYARQQYRHDYEVARVSTDNEAKLVKRAIQKVVDARQVPHLKVKVQ